MSSNDDDAGIKVTDRRMFTADGELREPDTDVSADAAGGEETSTHEPAQARDVEPAPESRPAGGSLPKPGFAELVSVLAEPIALFLGDVPLPDGKSAENLELA